MTIRTIPAVISAAAFLLSFDALGQYLVSGRWVDLTHPFNAESVYWPTAKMFEIDEVFAGRTEGGY